MFPLPLILNTVEILSLWGAEGDLDLEGTNEIYLRKPTDGAGELSGQRTTAKCKCAPSHFADTLSSDGLLQAATKNTRLSKEVEVRFHFFLKKS